MAAERSLVVSPEAEVSVDQWQVLREQASVFVQSGFLPSSIRTPEQALTLMMTGRELGIPPMTAVRTISVVDGKPTIAAELMAAMIYRDHGSDALVMDESTEEQASYRYKRRGWPGYRTFTFTIEQARKAGLLGKKNWQGYPAAMLRARCVSALARIAFPDTIGGMFTPEELDPDLTVSEGGAVVQQRRDPLRLQPEPRQIAPSPEVLPRAGTPETEPDAEYGMADEVAAIDAMAEAGELPDPDEPAWSADAKKHWTEFWVGARKALGIAATRPEIERLVGHPIDTAGDPRALWAEWRAAKRAEDRALDAFDGPEQRDDGDAAGG